MTQAAFPRQVVQHPCARRRRASPAVVRIEVGRRKQGAQNAPSPRPGLTKPADPGELLSLPYGDHLRFVRRSCCGEAISAAGQLGVPLTGMGGAEESWVAALGLLRCVLAHQSVDRLTDQVGMAGVAGVFLDHVD